MGVIVYCVHGNVRDHDWEENGQAYVCIADLTKEEYDAYWNDGNENSDRGYAVEMLYGRMNGRAEQVFGAALVEELGDRVLSEMYYEDHYGSVVFYMEGGDLSPL